LRNGEGINLWDETACFKGPLLSLEDVEIIVGGVSARVTLCAERSAKDDEVLGYRGVDDVHRAHGAAGVVEDPLFGLADRMLGVRLPQSVDDLVDDCSCVVGIVGEGAQGQLVQLGGIKDVPSLLVERT
jgi:hypothetical protein